MKHVPVSPEMIRLAAKRTTGLANIISLLFITALAVGCAGARITSTADPTYTKAVTRLFILARLPDTGWGSPNMFSFSASHEGFRENAVLFKTTLENRFQKISVTSSCNVKIGLELDDDAYLKAMKSFDPHALLVIDCTTVELKNSVISKADFNLSLIDAATGKRFWRANLTVGVNLSFGGRPSGDKIANDIFDALVTQLKRDKMDVFSQLEPL